jgi:Muramidase (flagellum-specific)
MQNLEFIKKYIDFARESEAATGMSYLISLTQGALESAWGESAPGNNFFGEKDSDGVNGNEQLLTTTEYSKSKMLKFPVIMSTTWDSALKLWKFRVKDYFRKYPSAKDGFIAHAYFFKNRPRYAKAWVVRNDPYLFFKEAAAAGYATAPNYAAQLTATCQRIEQLIKINKL